MQRSRFAPIFALMAVQVWVGLARAADATWDGGGSNNDWATADNWNPDGTPTFNADLNVIFYSSPAQLSNFIGTSKTIGSLNFNDSATSGVTIRTSTTDGGSTGSTLTLGSGSVAPAITMANPGVAVSHEIGVSGSNGTITLANDLTVTINGDNVNRQIAITSPITETGGSHGITLSGTGGQLTLGAANTFTGSTVITSSILSLTNANALQNSPFDTTSSVVGTDSRGLRTTGTALNLGGLIGDKNLVGIYTLDNGGYSSITAITLNTAFGSSHSYSGVIEDSRDLIKTGEGTQTLSGALAYTGTTAINAGTLLIDGTHAGGGTYTVASGAAFGGTGETSGNVTFSGDALMWVVDLNNPIVIGGTVSFGSEDGGFGINRLQNIDWGNTAFDTYTLIDNATVNFTNVRDVGIDNAVVVAPGVSAYFQSGSLQLVVVPEPSTIVLGAIGMAGMAYIASRRRRV